MNELQRQAYLSSFGIENYMPRWVLPAAPESRQVFIPCEPLMEGYSLDVPEPKAEAESLVKGVADQTLALLDEPAPKPAPEPVSAASILELLGSSTVAIAPFSLSVWRPQAGFLLIDARAVTLALPTELLLVNILKAVFSLDLTDLQEEVLRWPAVENRFVKQTLESARSELQTWLAVENELRPIKRLWLLGENSARYLLAADQSYADLLWQQPVIPHLALPALVLPSLSELLQSPALKSRLWSCLKSD